MHEIIASPDNVIAVKVADKLNSDDLEAIMDRLDEVLAQSDKVHVFVECRSIEGIELSGLGNYMGRAMPLMTKLNRFGRVGVVADQAWLRFATRLESAILPFISYRVYEPDRRDEAFAWVTGATTD
jgi:hypothetical protein